jgi:flagellar motor switch protein FliN
MSTEQFETPSDVDRFPIPAMNSLEHEVQQEDTGFLKNIEVSEPTFNLQNDAALVPTGDHSPSGAFLQIPIAVQVILGGTTMILSKVMALGPGSIISLDQKLSEPVRLLVNGNEFARGNIVVIDEASGQLGVTLIDIAADSTSSKNLG